MTNEVLYIVKGAELNMKSLARKLVVLMVALVLVLTSGVVAFAEEEIVAISIDVSDDGAFAVEISITFTDEEQYNLLSIAVASSIQNLGEKFAALADAKAAKKGDADIVAAAEATADALEEVMDLYAEKSALATKLAWKALGVDPNSGIALADIEASADRAFAVGEELEEIDPEAAVRSFELAAILYERCAVAFKYFDEAEVLNETINDLTDPEVEWAESFALRDVASLRYSAAGLLEIADELMADVKPMARDAA